VRPPDGEKFANRKNANCINVDFCFLEIGKFIENRDFSLSLGSAKSTILYDAIPVWEHHPSNYMIPQGCVARVCHFGL
jgi:hypothetical protein